MKIFSRVALLVAALMFLAGPADAQSRKFKASLFGSEEVPPVDTGTTGKFKVKFNKDLTEAKFELRVKDGIAIRQAHLHCQEEGENGPVVVFLSGNIPGGFDVNGRLAKATLTDDNITAQDPDCEPEIGIDINNISDLRDAMEAGGIYVNVHSVANPGGEVRGQVE